MRHYGADTLVAELTPRVEALVVVDVGCRDHLAVGREPDVVRLQDAGGAPEVDAFPSVVPEVRLRDRGGGFDREHPAPEGEDRHDLRFLAEQKLVRRYGGI